GRVHAGDALEIVERLIGRVPVLVAVADLVGEGELLLARLDRRVEAPDERVDGGVDAPELDVNRADHRLADALAVRIAGGELELVDRVRVEAHFLVGDAEIVVGSRVRLRDLRGDAGLELREDRTDAGLLVVLRALGLLRRSGVDLVERVERGADVEVAILPGGAAPRDDPRPALVAGVDGGHALELALALEQERVVGQARKLL